IVCPALFPPWKRITRSAFSARRSVIFPLPSSPHWAPMMTMPGISESSLRGEARRSRLAVRRLAAAPRTQRLWLVPDLAPGVLAVHDQRVAAHLPQAGDGAV